MSLRAWALKRGELRPLDRSGLLLFSVRCAMRVEPWMPDGADAPWREGLTHVARAAFDPPVHADSIAALWRRTSDSGAAASNVLAETDEPRGRCVNSATQTLARAVQMTAVGDLATLKTMTIEAAKFSGSIPAVLAHAGRVRAPEGRDPVEFAALAMWDAIRADVAPVASAGSEVALASDRVAALRELAPLWPDGVPSWTGVP